MEVLNLKSVKFWVVFCLGFLFIASVFLFFFKPESTVSKVYNDLVACAPSLDAYAPDSDPYVKCRISVMEEAFIKHGPNTPALALEALTIDFPDYWYQCHYELHRAGESIASKVDFLSYIGDVKNNTCHSGIIHGVFDYIGKNAPDDSWFKEVVKVCDKLYKKDTSLVYSECSHSLGHALWMNYNDFYESLPYCKLLDESSGSVNCVFGLFMQAYAPINSDDGDVPWRDFSSEISTICDYWEDDETFQGCMIGAGYVYTRPYSVLSNMVHESGFSESLNVSLTELTESMLSSCAKHSKGYDICVNEISKQIPRSLRNSQDIRTACDLLGEFSRSNQCSFLS
jgi:hypothetical protein